MIVPHEVGHVVTGKIGDAGGTAQYLVCNDPVCQQIGRDWVSARTGDPNPVYTPNP